MVLLATLASSAPTGPEGVTVVLEAHDGRLDVRALEELTLTDLGTVGAAWLRFPDAPLEPDPTPGEALVEVELWNRDRLRGRIAGGSGETLRLDLEAGVELAIGIDEVRSLAFPGRLPDDSPVALEPAGEGDRLYRRIGDSLDRIDGAVAAFLDEGVAFDSVLGVKTFEWGEVGALFLESFGGAEEAPSGGPGAVVVDLVDGSRLRGELVRLDRLGCRLRIGAGSELLLPPSVLSEVAVDDGTVAYLSDLVPVVAVEPNPFGDDLGMRWPHRMDRAVTGGALTAGGRVYARGIGVHAPSRLEWELAGSWTQLRGSVAIDDQVLRLPSRGEVVFRVEVDGRPRWESEAGAATRRS